MEISQLKFYSRGIVTAAKGPDTDVIMVTPIEYRFMAGGSVGEVHTLDEVNHNVGGGEDVVVGRLTNAIPARWLKFNTNRITPPNVMPKDEVLIWRMGDTDIFYWQDMNISNVKRLEEVTFAFAADPNNKMKDDLSNAYYMTMSPRGKHFTFQTSKANGEPFAFTTQYDTENGVVQITDDVGDVIFLDAKNTNIGFQNRNGTYINLNKSSIFGFARKSIELEALEKISLKTKEFIIDTTTYKCTAKNSYNIDTKSYVMTCKSQEVTSDTVKYMCPMSTFTGQIICASLSVGGAGSSKGASSCVVKGNMDVDGSIVVTESLTAKAINTDELIAKKGTITTFSHGGSPCC